MITETGFWILTIELRHARRAIEIIDDLGSWIKDQLDWQATDTATIFDEEAKDELETILHQHSIEFSIHSN
jgi:hypothetical protein